MRHLLTTEMIIEMTTKTTMIVMTMRSTRMINYSTFSIWAKGRIYCVLLYSWLVILLGLPACHN
jgi:predicted solute-binding protein